MNLDPVISKFIKLVATMIAEEVTKHLGEVRKPGEAAAAVQPAPEVFVAEVVAERSEEEWKADCLAIINQIAPTHGPQLRKLFLSFGAKRLPDLTPDQLPALMAELVSLRDA